MDNNSSLDQLLQERIIFLGGAGGKTSLMSALRKVLLAQGKTVICSTSTKIFQPQEGQLLLCQNLTYSELQQTLTTQLVKQRWLTLGQGLANSKVLGLPTQLLTQLMQDFPQTYFIIEADGSAQKPLKFPRPDEPVLPEALQLGHLIIIILGLSGLNQPVQTVVQRFELAQAKFKWSTQLMTPAMLCQLGTSLLHNCGSSPKILFYNQADLFTQSALNNWQPLLKTSNSQHFMGSVHAQSCQAF